MKAKTPDASMSEIEPDQTEQELQSHVSSDYLIKTLKFNHALQSLTPHFNEILAFASTDIIF